MTDSNEEESGLRPAPAPAAFEAWVPGALPAAQMAFVAAIQQKGVAAFAEELSARLDKQIGAQLGSPQPQLRSDFERSVEEGGCLIAMDADPVRARALVAFSPGLVAYLLRSLLGAPAAPGDEVRAVTEIELHILGEIFESLARELSNAWNAAGIRFRFQAAGGRETGLEESALVVFECRLELGEMREAFRIAIPAFLARIAALQSAPLPAEESPARDKILTALLRGSVSVEAALPGSRLRMEDLLAMEPGHVLTLAQPAGSPIDCLIGGKPLFRGEFLTHAGRQALLLL
jgi:flagellar motor switch protein FliM